MTSGHLRGHLVLAVALLLCLWVASIASAAIGPVNYEWYQDDTHRAKVEETFIPWQEMVTWGPDWYKGPDLNCWEYTVDVDPSLYVDSFTIHASGVTLADAWNANGWDNPLTGVPLDDITWTMGQGAPLDGQTGMFRMWANAQRGIITGSLHWYTTDLAGAPVDDGIAGGDVSGPVTTPEPGSLVLLVCGIAGAGGLLRRRLG
jgi:hypothetical protein